MRILLITPPMVQINAPYPATATLAGFLREHGYPAAQADLSLGLALRLFSADGLRRVAAAVASRAARRDTASVRAFRRQAQACVDVVDAVLRFLQGRDPTLAYRFAERGALPEGPRFTPLDAADDPLRAAFGALGVQDRARHLASLFLDDLTDVVRDAVDPRFGLARYAERLAAAAPDFGPIAAALEGRPTLVDHLLDELTDDLRRRHRPDVVGLTVPFPGTLYGALRIARRLRAGRPRPRVLLGGGYPNTELRDLSDPRPFDYVDAILLDDGELPLLRYIEWRAGKRPEGDLVRTFRRRRGRVEFQAGAEDAPPSDPLVPSVPSLDSTTPAYEDLPLADYVSVVEMLNPMHRLWSDGRWLKLTAARGCYWHRCRFCDTSLPYIARYRPTPADELVDRMERLIARTGQSGFHFTDEALPPVLARTLCERLLARGVTATWWGNIRFDPAWTPDLSRLMARAGCVAVTGGLEAAHDRLLALLGKGITVAGAARACAALSEAGMLVHAYLMYGVPTQTAQEAVDALEAVRRFFAAGRLHSAYWHRFALTAHSPLARDAAALGLRLRPPAPGGFARNELAYDEPGAPDWPMLGDGLRRAVYNYMQGRGLDVPVTRWFAARVPRPKRRTP